MQQLMPCPCCLKVMEQKTKNYYSGTSGLILPVPNKLHYPEQFKNRSRLCYYSSLMNTIEINSSFYKIPMFRTVEKWACEVGNDFRFSFKLFKKITHGPQLGFDANELSRFMHAISAVGEKSGCLLVQFPPSIRIGNVPQLTRLIRCLLKNDARGEWKIALEFRHPSLYVEEVMEILEKYGLGMVIHDKTMGAGPLRGPENNFRYLRFHGPGGDYRGSYTEYFLSEYADYIAEWLTEGKEVFVYFNNTMGDASGNLKMLCGLVADRV